MNRKELASRKQRRSANRRLAEHYKYVGEQVLKTSINLISYNKQTVKKQVISPRQVSFIRQIHIGWRLTDWPTPTSSPKLSKTSGCIILMPKIS